MLTFIDESGYPRPTDSTKNPILLGVCIHENDIKPITNQIYKLKNSIYGKQDEIKSTKLIREATITKNRTNNKAYVEGMVDIITSYDAAIFAVIMDKPDEPIIVPEHHLPKQYYLLLLEMPLFVSSAVTPAVQFADTFAGIVRHYYENELDQKEPGTEFQEWLVELFTKLHNLTENNFIPKSHYLEYGFQKMGKNFSYPVSEKFTTSDNDESLLSE